MNLWKPIFRYSLYIVAEVRGGRSGLLSLVIRQMNLIQG